MQLAFEWETIEVQQQRKNAALPEYNLRWEDFVRGAWLCDEAIICALSGKVRRGRWLGLLPLITQWLKKNWRKKFLPEPVHMAAYRAGIIGLEVDL